MSGFLLIFYLSEQPVKFTNTFHPADRTYSLLKSFNQLLYSDCLDLAQNALWKGLYCYAASCWLGSKVFCVYFVECSEVAHIC